MENNTQDEKCKADLLLADPAFPQELGKWKAHGLSRREYFAAMFLQNLCSPDYPHTIEDQCQLAIKYADTLMELLKKR